MLELIKFLLKDAEEQIRLMEEYHSEVEKAKEIACEKKNGMGYWSYLNWDKPIPKKAVVLDNLKMLRRISVKLSKEVEENREFWLV